MPRTRLTFPTTQVLRFSIPVLQPTLTLQTASTPLAQPPKQTHSIRKARDIPLLFLSLLITHSIGITVVRAVRSRPSVHARLTEISKTLTTMPLTSCSLIPTALRPARVSASAHLD